MLKHDDSLFVDAFAKWQPVLFGDNWKLTYYGNKETSYDAIVKEIVAKNLTKYDDQLKNMTKGVFDVYSTAISNLTYV